MYEIRLCKADEISLLTDFLRHSWSQDHIFLRNKGLLDFQHETPDGYNFVVAYHLESNCFHGVLGIVSPDFYTSRNIYKNQDVWLAIWKVDKNLAKSNSLGMDMLEFVEAEFTPRSVSAIGINDTVALLYRLMGFKTKAMNQWFLPNRDIVDPKLIEGALPASAAESESSAYKTIECGIEQENELEMFLSQNKSKRSFRYLVERYLNHPTYKYSIYAILKADSSPHAVVVGRKVIANGANAFRITELFREHDVTLDVKASLNEIMVQNACEYMDFLEYGFDGRSLVNCGFIKCSDSLFVPHLFEPFVADRKEVKIAFKSNYSFSCTKGDSDLDRPNQG